MVAAPLRWKGHTPSWMVPYSSSSHPTHCRLFHCSAQLTTLVLTSDGFGVCQHLLVLMLAPAVVERSYTPLLVPHVVPPGAQLIYPTAVPQP